jgi:hypothetical protein
VLCSALSLRVMIMLSYVFHMNVIGFTIKLRLPSIHVRRARLFAAIHNTSSVTHKKKNRSAQLSSLDIEIFFDTFFPAHSELLEQLESFVWLILLLSVDSTSVSA